MSWQRGCSDITIGGFRFAGPHQVSVSRSLHSYAESATIVLPSICKITEGKRKSEVVLTTANQFQEGDPVIINLGYNDGAILTGAATPITPNTNGGLGTVFRGFVKRKGLGMPLVVECEGYVRKLRLDIDVNIHRKTTSASELLNLLKTDKDGKPTGIKVVVANDLPLVNVRVPHNNGVEIIDAVKRFSQGVLNVFFIDHDTLWCGLTYTPYSKNTDPFGLGTVQYRLGWNAIKDNELRERVPTERVQILFEGTLATGEKLMAASDDKTAKQKQKSVFNHLGDVAVMKQLANEKQFMANYAGYEGSINAFLQPWCAPGWIADIRDARYPARDGKYMVESTVVTYGMRGARIKVGIGPRLGFNSRP